MHHRVVNPQVRLVPVNPYETCTVRLDKNRLAQILTNFVTNAIKYTSKGTIEMGYEKIDENIRLYVRDTGIGIPEDKKDLWIFSKASVPSSAIITSYRLISK